MNAQKKFRAARKGQIINPTELKLKSGHKMELRNRKHHPNVLKGSVKKDKEYTASGRGGESSISSTTLHHAKNRSDRSISRSFSRDKTGKSPQISSVTKKKISEQEIKSILRSKPAVRGNKEVEIRIRPIRRAHDVENHSQKTSKSRSISRNQDPFQSKAKKRIASLAQSLEKDNYRKKRVRVNRKNRRNYKSGVMASKSKEKETPGRRISPTARKSTPTPQSKSKSQISSDTKNKISEIGKNEVEILKEVEILIRQIRKAHDAENHSQKNSKSTSRSRSHDPFQSEAKKRITSLVQSQEKEKEKDNYLKKVVTEERKTRSDYKAQAMASKSKEKETPGRRISPVALKFTQTPQAKSKSASKNLERSRRKEVKTVGKLSSVSASKEITKKRAEIRPKYTAVRKTVHVSSPRVRRSTIKTEKKEDESSSSSEDKEERRKIKKQHPIRQSVQKPARVKEEISSEYELRQLRSESRNITEQAEINKGQSVSKYKPSQVKKPIKMELRKRKNPPKVLKGKEKIIASRRVGKSTISYTTLHELRQSSRNIPMQSEIKKEQPASKEKPSLVIKPIKMELRKRSKNPPKILKGSAKIAKEYTASRRVRKSMISYATLHELRHSRSESRNITMQPEIKKEQSALKEKSSQVKKPIKIRLRKLKNPPKVREKIAKEYTPSKRGRESTISYTTLHELRQSRSESRNITKQSEIKKEQSVSKEKPLVEINSLKMDLRERINPPSVLKGSEKIGKEYTPSKRGGESTISYTALHRVKNRSDRSSSSSLSHDNKRKTPQISSANKTKMSEVASKEDNNQHILRSMRGQKEVEILIKQIRKTQDAENQSQKTNKSRSISRSQDPFQSEAKKRIASLVQSEEKEKEKDNYLKKVVAEDRKTRSDNMSPPRKNEGVASKIQEKETPGRRVSTVTRKSPPTPQSKSKSASKNNLERSRRKEVKTVGQPSSVSASKESTKRAEKTPKYVAARKTAHGPSPGVRQSAKKAKINASEDIQKEETNKNKNEPPIEKPAKVKEEIPKEPEVRQLRSDSRNITEKAEIKKEQSESKEKPSLVKKPLKHNFTYNVDTKGISDEITKIIKKIEEKKKQKMSPLVKVSSASGGKEKVYLAKKLSAKDYGFKLQRNPNIKVHHFVDFKDISSKPLLHNTDLLVAILEIAGNCEYYQIAYSNTSRMFWGDIVNYNELKNIFNDYKPETLRKYWLQLSAFDVEKIVDLINKHKKFLDDFPVKLGTIVNSIKDFFEGKITDLEDYIKNMQIDVRKREIFDHEIIDTKTGTVTKITNYVTTTKSRKRYEPGHKKKFEGKNYEGVQLGQLGEVYGENPDSPTDYQHLMKKIVEENNAKFKLLKEFTEEEKKKLMAITEDDKFLFKIIDSVVEGLMIEFPQYSKEYVLEVLIGNSMSIFSTYKVLRFPEQNQGLIFTQVDDEVIRTMKGKEEYSGLNKAKGESRVLEREDFLFE